MTKIMAAHQPNYLPYLGFFDKLRAVDELGTEPGMFIIRDDAQYVKKEFHDRNKIRVNEGGKWLKIPVEKKMAPLNTIEIKEDGRINNVPWADYHIRQIDANYKKTPFFEKFSPELKEIYQEPKSSLVDFNMDLIKYISECFGLDTEIILFSDFGEEVNGNNASETLANAAKEVGADIYLSGAGGKGYLDTSYFNNNLKLEFQEYEHPIYKQRFKNFEPYMSSIDALFNIGYLPRSGEVAGVTKELSW